MSRIPGPFLVLLALWMQILAPVTAVRMGPPADAPLAGLTLCGHGLAETGLAATESGATQDGATDPRGMPAPCGLCCTVVAVLDAPPPGVAGVALVWSVLVFLAPPEGAPASHAPSVPRARDPPVLA